MFLLDTNVCIHYIRGKNVAIRQRMAAHSADEIRLCSVVLAELYVGALSSAKPAKNRADVDQFAAPFASLTFDDAAADEYARVRRRLEMMGTPIGPYDMQIAAIALVNDCTLVTNNTGEFVRVAGLKLEDWQVP